MQAIIYCIDKSTYEVKREDDDQIIDNLDELGEELPDTSPRFILLSYPFTSDDGRLVSPLVLLYWKPQTCGQEAKMLYAGAIETFRDKAGVSKLIQVEEEEELESIEDELK